MAGEVSPRPWSIRISGEIDHQSVAIIDARGGVVCLMKAAGGRKIENARAIIAAVKGGETEKRIHPGQARVGRRW